MFYIYFEENVCGLDLPWVYVIKPTIINRKGIDNLFIITQVYIKNKSCFFKFYLKFCFPLLDVYYL